MGKASERRIERIKSLLQSTLADVIRDELSDPRLGIFSMTEIQLTPDLGHATVMVATVGGAEATEQSVAVLNRAAPLLWNRLRSETDLRTVPKLHFRADVRGEYSDQVELLLQQVRPQWDDTVDNDEDDSREDAGEGGGTSAG